MTFSFPTIQNKLNIHEIFPKLYQDKIEHCKMGWTSFEPIEGVDENESQPHSQGIIQLFFVLLCFFNVAISKVFCLVA